MNGRTEQITKPKTITYEVKNYDDDMGFKVIAKKGEEIVGQLFARDMDSCNTLFVVEAYVLDDQRNKGIATEMNKLLVDTAKKRGYLMLFCNTNIDNNAIDKVLLRTGWHLVSVARNMLYYYQNLVQR